MMYSQFDGEETTPEVAEEATEETTEEAGQ